MIYFLVTTLVTALGLLVTDIIFPGVDLSTFTAAILAAIALGAVNAGLRPILGLLTLPINIVTLGGFSLVVNGFCFWFASLFVPGFVVHGPLAFIFAPLLLSLATAFLDRYVSEASFDRLPGRKDVDALG